jgi:Replication initiator protein A
MQSIVEPTESSTPIASLNRIRVETALSRFPIHRLAKKNNINIDIQRLTEEGDADFKWEVTYNQKHGQPGPLAYKVDTLVVNRRIDEANRPLPEVIKLGSLTELCAMMEIADSGENRNNLKKALHQNASTYITAKIRYRTKTGKERWGEIGYTRYSVVFTGEALPDQSAADAVYIVPNPSYRDLLNHVEVRPLDYDYLMLLAPGPQRLYELLSFQIYGALASGRPRAKMLYSDYCKYAPQTRYPDFDHVKKQMFKIHVPHRKSGYITKIEYQETSDVEGQPDWEMLYTPGPKAIAEFEAFTNRQSRLQAQSSAAPSGGGGPSVDVSRNASPLIAEMTRRGITEKKARELVANLKPGQEVMDQLDYVDSLVAKDKKGRMENPPGLYVLYIRDNVPPPANFLTSHKRKLQQQAVQSRQADKSRAAEIKVEYETYCATETKRYIREILPPDEYHALFQQHIRCNRQMLKHSTDAEIEELTHGTIRAEIQKSGRVNLISFEEFCRKHGSFAA